jgi:kinesin family protein C1
MENEEEEAEAGVMGTRKGTPIISFAPSGRDNITLRKTRTHGDLRQNHKSDDPRIQHSGSYANGCGSREGSLQEQTMLSREPSLMRKGEPITGQPTRDISLSTAFTALSLDPEPDRKISGKRYPPSLEYIKGEDSPSKIPTFTPSLRHTQSAQTLQTPSPLKHKPPGGDLRTPTMSAKRKKDPLPVFLTKETLTSVPAWDTKGRLEDMVSRGVGDQDEEYANNRQESLYAMLRTQFASAADSKTALEESLSIYKSRGLHPRKIQYWNVN